MLVCRVHFDHDSVHVFQFEKRLWAQQNFNGPEFVFAKFSEVLKNHLAANLILKLIWVKGWGKMAPGKVREGDNKLVRLG